MTLLNLGHAGGARGVARYIGSAAFRAIGTDLDRIYLDHAATTPMRPEAVAAVEEGMRRWANPSSPHAEGRAARAALEEARGRIKAALEWDDELIFTSGASEALAIGLGRAKAERRLISAVEHEAVFRAAPDAQVLPIDGNGEVDRDILSDSLRGGGRALVAIQDVNSEIGQHQPLDELAPLVRKAGGLLLADCSQSAGKEALPDADLIVVSAHKLGGPPGIGALLVRDLAMIEAGGGQEFGYRSGTENLPGALGFAAALEWWRADKHHHFPHLDAIENLAEAIQEAGGTEVLGPPGARLVRPSYWIGAFSMPGLKAVAQLIRFDMAGFAVSAGSACASGSLKPSRALAAFGVPAEVAECTIRVSYGWSTTADDIDAFRDAWLRIAEDTRVRAA
jgi:cysteine desulfurase